MEFAKRLKKLRLKRGWTQQKLADLTGLTQSHVCNLEVGRNQPVLSTLHKVRAALGCSWNTLLGDL